MLYYLLAYFDATSKVSLENIINNNRIIFAKNNLLLNVMNIIISYIFGCNFRNPYPRLI